MICLITISNLINTLLKYASKVTHPTRSEEASCARTPPPKIGQRGSNFNSPESEKAFWAAGKTTPEEANKEAEKLAKGTPVHPPSTSSPTPSDCQYSVETDNPFVNQSPRNQTPSDLFLPLDIVSSVNNESRLIPSPYNCPSPIASDPVITLHIETDVFTTPCQPTLPRVANTEETDKTEDYKASHPR